jgi:outer membrane immunogenic protein
MDRQGVVMNKLLLGSFAIALTMGGSAAMAADMPLKAPPPPVLFSWTGCYVGIEGGGAWGRSQHRFPQAAGPFVVGGPVFIGGVNATDTFNVSGGVAGVEYGCNQQFGSNWVFGLEGDWSWSSKRGTANDILPAGNPLITSETKERWVSTSRMRIGYTWDRAWLYVTGGFAAARVDLNVDATAIGFGILTDRKTVYGWTAGAGFEYAFLNNWSLKVEYLYMNFGENRYLTLPPAGFGQRSFTLDDHIVRAGLNWRFTECVFGSCPAPAPLPVYTK